MRDEIHPPQPDTMSLTPTIKILEAVADTTNTDPIELPPLADAIDPDALNTIFNSPQDNHPRRLEFIYNDCQVQVTHADTTLTVQVTPATQLTTPRYQQQ